MTTCRELPRYLDNELTEVERTVFAQHLMQCSSCREMATRWRAATQEISSMTSDFEQTLHVSNRSEVNALIARAKTRKASDARPQIRLRPALVGASILILCGILYFYLYADRPTSPIAEEMEVHLFRAAATSPELHRAKITKDAILRTRLAERLLLHIDNDVIGVGPASNVRIVEKTAQRTHLRLERGAIACQIAPRQQRGDFVVDAGSLSIRVKGTRFMVKLHPDDAVSISVVEGRVEVIDHVNRALLLDPAQKLTLTSDLKVELTQVDNRDEEGLELLLSAHPGGGQETIADQVNEPVQNAEILEVKKDRRPNDNLLSDQSGTKEPHPAKKAYKRDKVSADISIEQMRDWILSDRLAEAKRALQNHLETHPADSEAWNLLADCLRKEGLFDEAIRAYESVIALGGPREAQRARFRAGALWQDKLHSSERAQQLFEEYLKGDTQHTLLKAEALFRLGQAYYALGKLEQARKVLSEVIEHHSGSAAAPRARRILDQIN